MTEPSRGARAPHRSGWRRYTHRTAGGAALAAALGCSWLGSAAARVYSPCESADVAARAESRPRPSDPAGHSEEPSYLILIVEDRNLLGSELSIDGRAAGHLPKKSGACTLLTLPAGPHSVRIGGLAAPVDVLLAARRTSVRRLTQGMVDSSNETRRFALRVLGAASDIPVELRQELLRLAAALVLDGYDLSEEASRVEPQPEKAALERLDRPRAACDPVAWLKEDLQFVVTLDRTPAGSHRVRAFNTAVGSSAPAAEVQEGERSAADCQGSRGSSLLSCLMKAALDRAAAREHSCVKVSTQPAGATVRLLPARAAAEPIVLGTTVEGRPIEQALFIDSSTPVPYELLVERERFIGYRKGIELRDGDSVSVPVTLQPVPNKPLALHKKWWLWQGLATVLTLGITGTVAGLYAGDRGLR